MIRQAIRLNRYDWEVMVYYAVTDYAVDEILMALKDIKCEDKYLKVSEESLRSRTLNTGITYSNPKLRKSVMVIGLADSPEQYDNSIAHERDHLATHIAQADGIDLASEAKCYLTGYIAEKMHRVSHRFVCRDCYGSVRAYVNAFGVRQ